MFIANKNQEKVLDDNYSRVINFMSGYGGGKTVVGLAKAINDLVLFRNGVNFICLDNGLLKHSMLECENILNKMNLSYRISFTTTEFFINDIRDSLRFYTVDQILNGNNIQAIAFRIIIDNADIIHPEDFLKLYKYCSTRLRIIQSLPYYHKDILKGQLVLTSSVPNKDIYLDDYWFYKNFVTNKRIGWRLIQSNLHDNPHLPKDFIDRIFNYVDEDKNWLESLVKGEFMPNEVKIGVM